MPGMPADDALHYRMHRDPRCSHQQIIRQVLRLRKEPILDVGAAQGMLGQTVKEAGGGGLVMDAVEMNPRWAEMARPYYRQVFATSIEAAPLPSKTYRTVVCGDVLEHTPDPVAVLRRLREAAA